MIPPTFKFDGGVEELREIMDKLAGEAAQLKRELDGVRSAYWAGRAQEARFLDGLAKLAAMGRVSGTREGMFSALEDIGLAITGLLSELKETNECNTK